ncbi:MAG TPA: hypothetical protein VNC50_16120, partial [Planctomycetia bacterium]|nr:hypothetical protein [Planctomycetia bacterium]
APRGAGPARFGMRGGRGVPVGGPPTDLWTKPKYRLAVIGIEFSDIKHEPKTTKQDWEAAVFGKNAPSPGSLRDYLAAQSYGALELEGRVFDWVSVDKKRADYSQGSGVTDIGALPADAVAKLLARDGAKALDDFDGVFIIYAGESVRSNRGAVYSPHAGQFAAPAAAAAREKDAPKGKEAPAGGRQRGRIWPYLVCYEGGIKMAPLSAYAREFVYLLGLPDLAARTENIGSEGVGAWCLLGGSIAAKPQSLSAWAKERMGWLNPAVVDPSAPQKVMLAGVASAPGECVKVLVRADGSEYFLLENRRREGWDSELPGEGLLIWRVLGGRPELQESHGVEGASGPRLRGDAIPYPSRANHSFTPLTSPSSLAARGGGMPVYITAIRRAPEGKIAFQIGVAYD